MYALLHTMLAVTLAAHPVLDCLWAHEHAPGASQSPLCLGEVHASHGRGCDHYHSVQRDCSSLPHKHTHAVAGQSEDSETNAHGSPAEHEVPSGACCGIHATHFLIAKAVCAPEPSWDSCAGLAPVFVKHLSAPSCAAVWTGSASGIGPPHSPDSLHLLFGVLLI